MGSVLHHPTQEPDSKKIPSLPHDRRNASRPATALVSAERRLWVKQVLEPYLVQSKLQFCIPLCCTVNGAGFCMELPRPLVLVCAPRLWAESTLTVFTRSFLPFCGGNKWLGKEHTSLFWDIQIYCLEFFSFYEWRWISLKTLIFLTSWACLFLKGAESTFLTCSNRAHLMFLNALLLHI